MKFGFIKSLEEGYPVRMACHVMGVSTSSYYAWKNRPAKIISVDERHLNRRAKELFKATRNSLGSRELCKKLREEGFEIGRERTRRLMQRLGLRVIPRQAYRVTTQRKMSHSVADNLLNQNFNPVAPNEVWAGDVTYLRTAQGWIYLAIVMDLYSRRIVGWAIDKHMKQDLVIRALVMAYNLRQPSRGLVFHSDRGSQYTGEKFRKLLDQYGMRASMGDVGACWDNAVVERFFGSLKHDWLYKVYPPTRDFMKQDVAAYMKYYNGERLHTSNGDRSPVQFENSQIKVSGLG